MTAKRDLAGKIAVVTGASRGGGRAVAQTLGEAGATVYVTGRSVRDGARTENRGETFEETAELVTAAGGTGIPVRVDHTNEDDVHRLFERVRDEQGKLDLLVNNAWGGYENYDLAEFTAPFWEQPTSRWEGMFTAGVRTHFLSNRYGAPLMIEQGSGLIVATVAWAFDEFLLNVYYDVAKSAIIRMMFGMAKELRPHGVSALAVAPGWMRTERVMDAHAEDQFDLASTESPFFLGRAVRALALDPDIAAKSGAIHTAGELAREYGFTDVDGRQPEPFRMPG
jgi:NAD(P)-dependent dehydrogenase (short-subunit alcohol dehydrogenase family)